MHVTVVGKDFEKRCTKKEKWYSTKYMITSIPEESVKKWEGAQKCKNLHLPQVNKFIPKTFDLVPIMDSHISHHLVIRDTPLTRLFFQQDDEFLLPKVYLKMKFFNPLAYSDPKHMNLAALLERTFEDIFDEFSYSASLADLFYEIDSIRDSIVVQVQGFSDKLSEFVLHLLQQLVTLRVKKSRFAVLKERLRQYLLNQKEGGLQRLAQRSTDRVLWERSWSLDERLAHLHDLKDEDLQEFVGQFFSRTFVDMLFLGNMRQSEALELSDKIEAYLKEAGKSVPLSKAQRVPGRIVELAKGTNAVYRTSTNLHESSCVNAHFQCGMCGTRDRAILELLSHILMEPCCDVLRTKEQLGLFVKISTERRCGVSGKWNKHTECFLVEHS